MDASTKSKLACRKSPLEATILAAAKMPQTVTGHGVDEIAALRALADRLRGRENAGRRLDELRQWLRLAYGSEALY